MDKALHSMTHLHLQLLDIMTLSLHPGFPLPPQPQWLNSLDLGPFLQRVHPALLLLPALHLGILFLYP